MRKPLTILLICPLLLFSQRADVTVNNQISCIAFGSCSKQDQPAEQLWKEINDTNPNLWIWLGDNIYGDTEDMTVMKEKYDLQKSHPDYQKLMRKTDVIGIWDDHDYGINDGGKEFAAKEGSKQQLLDFLDVAQNHPVRDRKGAYQSYTYAGKEGNIKVILLDTRYFRDSLKWHNPGTWEKASIVNPDGDILGEEQWKWFEMQLTEKDIDLFVVASGIQVIPNGHRWEKWSNFPKSRKRLFETISSPETPLVLLSGDRHLSEISKMDLTRSQFPIYEFTSSSLTSPAGIEKEENPFMVGEKIYERNFSLMSISWEDGKPTLNIRYHGAGGKLLLEHSIAY